MTHPTSNIVGVDIGGTKVAVGIVDSGGQVVVTKRARMVTDKTPEDGLDPILQTIEKILADPRAGAVSGIGISVAGWVDTRAGVLISATNLPCWKNYPLTAAIQEKFGIPARMANDAKAAVLAEAIWGAAVGHRNIFYVSLGTGIGTGIVVEKKLYYGRTGMAGEGGHMSIDSTGPQCKCGKRGCIEMYASGTAIAREARRLLRHAKHRSSRLHELAHGDISAVTALAVGQASMEGDALASQILRRAADALAIWLGNIIDLLEPEIIVFGGGLGHLMTSFRSQIRNGLDIWAANPERRQIKIVNAVYQSDSGIVGAAALCLRRTKHWLAAWQKESALIER